MVTLDAANLQQYFSPEFVLGRTCAEPKPSPAGIYKITSQWKVTPQDSIMVGDHYLDIEAGVQAGAMTIQVMRNATDVEHPKASKIVSSLLEAIEL